LAPYREFCGELGLIVIAEVFSDHDGVRDEIVEMGEDLVFRGSVHRLERGESVWRRPTIRALADRIIKLVSVLEIKTEGGVARVTDETRTYIIIKQDETTIRVGFGVQDQNDKIVKDATAILETMVENGELPGGEIMKINGPASIPVALVIAHALGHLYGAVAFFDPKLRKYVVSIAHGGRYQVGDLVD
jgi:CRISPR-associated protein Csx3